MSRIDKYLNNGKVKTGDVTVLEKLEVEEKLQETLEYLYDDELSEKAIEAAGWGKDSVEKFGKTIGKSPSEEGFFDACVSRMSPKKGWGKEKAKGFCARLIDTAKGTTEWRGKKVHEVRIIQPNEKAKDEDGRLIRPGDIVTHPRFGKGQIYSIDTKTYSIPMVTVEFGKDKIVRPSNELRKRG
jgi:hypothetical protein